MLRELLIGRKNGGELVFTQRGQDVSRIEGFSDAVFGFALTLLVVSQQVPHTFDELLATLRGFFAFAVCFAVLVSLWYRHYQFFRRYGMQDTYTIALNAALLFVVLFFVYPLKFLVTFMLDKLMGIRAGTPDVNGTLKPVLKIAQLPFVFNCYFVGFATVCLVFALLYRHAYHNRVLLNLTPHEVCATRLAILYNVFPIGVCLATGALMFLTQSRYYAPATAIYAVLIIIGVRQFSHRARKLRRSVLEQTPENAAVATSSPCA